MLRFEQHTETNWNVFRKGGRGDYVAMIRSDGTCLPSGTRTLTAAELRQIADKLDELNQKRQEGV